MPAPEELVRVGRVIKPHGIHEELAVEPEGDTLGLLPSSVAVHVGEPPVRLVLQGVRPHAGRLLVTLEGIDDRTAAETLRGAWLRIALADLPAPDEDSVYVDDLVGCRLETEAGEPVGTVRGILAGRGQDLLQVQTDDGEILVPMVRDWLVELDTAARRIRMRLPTGLTTSV